MAGLIEQVDAKIAEILSGWNIYTTLIALLITALLVGSIIYTEEPDVHPMLLARGSSASMVRQPGESALYRSHGVPHGYPLRTGLQVASSRSSEGVFDQSLTGCPGQVPRSSALLWRQGRRPSGYLEESDWRTAA